VVGCLVAFLRLVAYVWTHILGGWYSFIPSYFL
jgi:hypothetical protein